MKYGNLFVTTLYHAIRVRFFTLMEWILEIGRYLFTRPKYLLADALLVLSYFWKSPYRSIREWDETHEQKIGPYGELPLSEMHRIYELLLADKKISTFYDFGAGRGRVALWAALCQGWNSFAVEIEPTFCRKLQRVARSFRVKNLHVVQKIYQDISLEESDLVFMNPGELEALQEEKLMEMLSRIKDGAYVLSIGFALSHPTFAFEGMMPLTCAWQEDIAVLQRKVPM